MEANNEAVCVLAGVGGGDIIMAEWNNGVGRPCHYVAVDRASRQIVLSVRFGTGSKHGSAQLKHLLTWH